MPEFDDRESVQKWLEGRPVEDARLIAARAALRVLPLIYTALDKKAEDRRAAILLPVLRALAVASFAGNWPKRSTEVREAASIASAATIEAAADAVFAEPDAGIAVDIAAHAANASFADAANVSSFAAFAVAASFAAFPDIDAATSAQSAFEHDANRLEARTDHTGLANSDLWPDTPIPSWIYAQWSHFRHHLRHETAEEDWEPWIDWYESILNGDPGVEELELQKALIPHEIWEQGPKAVNEEIARLTREFFGRTTPQAEMML